MSIEDISNEIERIQWANKNFANGGLHLCELGINEEQYPLVFKCRDMELRVSQLRRNCRVFLRLSFKGEDIRGFWALHNDLPPKTLKEIYKIVKKLNK